MPVYGISTQLYGYSGGIDILVLLENPPNKCRQWRAVGRFMPLAACSVTLAVFSVLCSHLVTPTTHEVCLCKKELWIFYMLIAERQQEGQSGSCPVWIWAQHSICANQVRPRRWNYGGGETFEMLGLPMPVPHCFFPSFPSWHSQRVAKGLGTQASAQPICNAGREHRHCMALSSTSFSGRLPAKRDVSVGLICESSIVYQPRSPLRVGSDLLHIA